MHCLVKRKLAWPPCLQPFLNNEADFLGFQFQAPQGHKEIIFVSGKK
jgi:hypothetical protein